MVRFDIIFKACQLTHAVIPKKTCQSALYTLQKWKKRLQAKDKDKEKELENAKEDDVIDEPGLENMQYIQRCVQTIQDHIKDNHDN